MGNSVTVEWVRLRDALDAALDLEGEARLLFCERIAHEDAALGAELRRMLDAHATARPLPSAMELAVPAALDLMRDDAEFDRARVGQIVGGYRLLSLLGTGGMGAVYLAEHALGEFEHRVALKVVRRSFGSRAAKDRFERERRILAGLKHPGIALLFDGGQTSEGQSFYTMEYVEGTSITDFCNERSLALPERIKLIAQIAATLSYAHQNLIIHRDIKPSNVLVTADSRVKLVDFGLAKLIDDQVLPSMTQTGLGPMTPAYAAPEQFRNGAITVATDIYQFGLLCFIVLTGRLPYRADPSDNLAWALAVTSEEPMSLRRAYDLAIAPEVKMRRFRRIERHLTQDLDAIVRKSLDKNPDRRYRSVDAMMADVEHYLDGRPVSARRAGPWYLLWRFALRWRYLLTAAFIATFIMSVDIGVYFRTASERSQRYIAENEVNEIARGVAANLLDARESPATAAPSSPQSHDELTGAGPTSGARPRELAIATGILAQTWLEMGYPERARRLLDDASPAMTEGSNLAAVRPRLALTYARAALELGDATAARQSFADAERQIRSHEHLRDAPLKLAAALLRLQLYPPEESGRIEPALADLIRASDYDPLNETIEFAHALSLHAAQTADERVAQEDLQRAARIISARYGADNPITHRAEEAASSKGSERSR